MNPFQNALLSAFIIYLSNSYLCIINTFLTFKNIIRMKMAFNNSKFAVVGLDYLDTIGNKA